MAVHARRWPIGKDWIAHDCSPNVAHLAQVMERFGLGDRWAYRFPIKPRWFGMSHAKRREVLRTADLLINVSGSLKRPSDYRAMRTSRVHRFRSGIHPNQARASSGPLKFQKRVSAHDVYFSFGERLSAGGAATTYAWQPTRQPILLSEWSTVGEHRRRVHDRHELGELPAGALPRAALRAERRRVPAVHRAARRRCRTSRFEVALNATEHVAWETDGDSVDRCGASARRRHGASRRRNS